MDAPCFNELARQICYLARQNFRCEVRISDFCCQGHGAYVPLLPPPNNRLVKSVMVTGGLALAALCSTAMWSVSHHIKPKRVGPSMEQFAETTPIWIDFGLGTVCRRDDTDDTIDPETRGFGYVKNGLDLTLCRERCQNDTACHGVEYRHGEGHHHRCEVWKVPVNSYRDIFVNETVPGKHDFHCMALIRGNWTTKCQKLKHRHAIMAKAVRNFAKKCPVYENKGSLKCSKRHMLSLVAAKQVTCFECSFKRHFRILLCKTFWKKRQPNVWSSSSSSS